MKLSIFVYISIIGALVLETQSWQDRGRYPSNEMSNTEDRSHRAFSNSISRYHEEKMTLDRLKKLAYKPHRPAPKLYYYYNPVEALRFEYQSLVPQTNDFSPIRYNPALWRAHHGYGFNEWGGQGVL